MASSTHPRPRRVRSKAPIVASVSVLLAVAVAVVVGFSVAAESDPDNGSNPAYTGELSSMNLPIIETPGAGSGTTEAAGVVVDDSSWSLGEVPLDTAVIPTWVLRNDGTEDVTLGEPHPEVRAGCCPGPLTLSHRTLEPGEEVTLDFELAMHSGMDGWHDIAVHVPVVAAEGETTIELEVTGDFRGR